MAIEETDLMQRKARIPLARDLSFSGVPSVEYGEEEERKEKPWQRIPCGVLLILLGVYMLLGYLTQLNEDAMPSVVHDNEVPPDNWETFSEESALRYLDQILGTEPRVAGTQYHLAKTKDMKAIVDGIARQSVLPIHTDWQFASGDFWLQFSSPHVNSYQNLSNVVAVLEGEAGFHPDGATRSSLLLNCHYDSVPYALGASDNGVFCAVMVEMLNRLSKRTKKFKHNIIFLFNGAEENPLQGSHAFLAHRWAKGVTSVVNLDAAGMNGKANLFQVSDTRVLESYAVSRRPSAQSLGELLFASNVVPSDTDFRIWRDFGDIHGLDIAFVKWGSVYHTRYDHPALLRPGVLQCAGDMLLALATRAADMDQLAEKSSPTSAVYYDYLNVFVVWYGAGAALAVDLLAGVAGLLSVGYYVWLVGLRKSSVIELCMAAWGRVMAMLAGALATTVLTILSLATTVQMRYLSEQWLVVPLYWLPYLVAAVAAAHWFDAWRSKKSGLNRSIRALQAAAATRLLLAALTLLLCCVPAAARARYVLSVPLLLAAFAAIVNITVLRCVRLAAWQHLLLEVSLSLPSVMFLMSLSLRLNSLLLPTLGRSPMAAPDAIAAAVNVALAVIVAAPVSGVELLFSRRRLWVALVSLAAVCLVVALVPQHPYRDDGPTTQRHHWFHSEIITHDANGVITERSSGVMVTPQDVYTTTSALGELRRAGLVVETRDVRADCERLFCDLPVYRLRALKNLENSLFINMEGPAPLNPPATLAVTSRHCAGDICTLHFVMNGPAHNTLTIWPHESVNLTGWSFSSAVRPTLAQRGRPVYVVIHSVATYSEQFEPLNFILTFHVPQSAQSTPLVAVSHHAHLIFHPDHYTGPYRALLAAAPQYFNIASYMSFRYNYVF